MQKSTGQSVPYAGTNRIRFHGLIQYLSARSPGHPNDLYLHKTGHDCCQDLADHACRAAVWKQPNNRYWQLKYVSTWYDGENGAGGETRTILIEQKCIIKSTISYIWLTNLVQKLVQKAYSLVPSTRFLLAVFSRSCFSKIRLKGACCCRST